MNPRALIQLLPAVLFTASASAAGPVVGWGSNVFNQTPVPAAVGPCLAIAGGGAHSVAIRTTGQVVCWGDNEYGQLQVPANLGTCTMIAAGDSHTVALRSNGTVAAWGLNIDGQGSVPANLGTCTQIAAGGYHNLALRSTGQVVAWGDNFDGQCAVPGTLGACVAIEAGMYHSLAVRANGTLVAWGLNDFAQASVPINLGTVVAIAAGDSHNAVIRPDGGVSCWGNNGQGQCTLPALKACTGIACGDFHTVALQQDGTVTAWGYSDLGQCTVPGLLPKCTQVAAGSKHTLALTTNIASPTGVSAADGTSLSNVSVTWNPVTGITGLTGYRVFRAVGFGLGTQIGTTNGPTTLVDATAVPGVAYVYWVKTITTLGDSAASASDTGWRGLPAPTGLVASDGTSTAGVNLTWTAASAGTGYRVFRSSAASSASEIGAPTSANFTDTTAVAGTLYTYTVRTTSTGGNSAPSNADTGWRGPTLPPPSGLAATDGSRTDAVSLSWDTVAGVTGYRVFRAIGSGAATLQGTVTVASYLDALASPGVVYTYTVRSIKGSAESASSVADTGWRAPPAPTGVTATDGTSTTSVTVSWTTVANVTGYRVMRAAGAATPVQVGTTGATTGNFSDTSAVAGTLYSYTVRATSPSGDSLPSTADTGWRNIAPPSTVLATDGSSTAHVAVSWNGASGAIGYKVFRTLGTATVEVSGNLASTVRAYNDVSAIPGTLYTYSVRARTAAGDSAASAANTGWKNVAAPTGLNATDGTSAAFARITWTIHPSAAVTGYRLVRIVPGSPAALVKDVTGRTVVACDDTAAPIGTVITYQVFARTAAGLSLGSATTTGWRNVAAPTGFTASNGTFTTHVALSWTASTSTAVTGYRVMRLLPGQTSLAEIALVQGRDSTIYLDPTIDVGVTGTYAVRAITAAGNSPNSATAVGSKKPGSGSGMAPPSGGSTGGEGDGGGTAGAGTVAGTGTAAASTGAPACATGTPTDVHHDPRRPGPDEGGIEGGAFLAPSCEVVLERVRALAAGLDTDADAAIRGAVLGLAAAGGGPEADCPACRILAGDVNLDGTVGAGDLEAFLEAWTAGDALSADIDRDGCVNGRDLGVLVGALTARPNG